MEQSEALVRAVAFGLAFLMIAGWELARPRRSEPHRTKRWPINLGLGTINTFLVRLIAPASGLGFAFWAERRSWGLLHNFDLPAWVELGLAVLILDAAVYFQHRVFHAISPLWTLHRVHHADKAFDVTTGVRFHPGEIVISTLYKGVIIVGVGASPAATLAFELLLSLGSLFSHANGRLLGDRVLRRLFVTPDMHRVHHSTRYNEQNSNFGFSFSWWDRMFGTYRPHPLQPHESMDIGIEESGRSGKVESGRSGR